MNDPEVICKFIEAYKQLPCLWSRDTPGYRVRKTKYQALTKLLAAIKDDCPDATIETVLRKIGSLRASHRKERLRLRMLQSCNESSRSQKALLWYYDKLSFLNTEYARRPVYRNEKKSPEESTNEQTQKIVKKFKAQFRKKRNRQDSEEEETEILFDEEDSQFDQRADPEYVCMAPSMVEVSENSRQLPGYEEDPKAKRLCTEVEDEYDAIGLNVAAKLRSLPQNMRILAEKLINDVLFQAQTNGLNASTVISTTDPFKQESL